MNGTLSKPDVAGIMFANASATISVVRRSLDEAKTIPEVLAVITRRLTWARSPR